MSEHNYEMKFLEAAASELKSYLLSGDIYRDLGVRAPATAPPYPQFSLGWLLLFRRRVQADPLTEEERGILKKISESEEQWQSNWGKKAAQEFSMRLKLWARFMSELRDHPDSHKSRYPYEVQRRTMLDLLAQDADEIPTVEMQLLHTTDSALRGMLAPAPFIEDNSHAVQFPPDRFWYLYGLPKSSG